MFKKNKKKTPFEEYYKIKLEKDTLTHIEFTHMITDYFLGFGYYIADSISGDQARRIIFDNIMRCFPQSRSRIHEDEDWLDNFKCNCLQRVQKDKEDEQR